MRIGGLQKVSLIDYPGYISCVVFVQGCNFRCYYCHNPQLVYPELFCEPISEESVLNYITTRKNYLDAVVICGGEPTIQDDIVEFVKHIKKLGLKVKLDTNGSNPQILEKVIKHADFISMDIKSRIEKYKYSEVCGVDVDIEKIKNSIKIILNSSVEYEFRTTIDNKIVDIEDIKSINNFFSNFSFVVKHKIQHINKWFSNNSVIRR
ncbi:MAG: anaerobic ribonucleoside-triphosphate reductase activating protein [Endomicrobia bacterium]|nr:anaerobic ribonucleoside-triphosphate reductase activating protein [Endomicrobiia bacterium]MDW8056358.1 anaerobic ribonucleoside-triphosphate reductase activating protein [Elusimicrobiota bacterium]